MNQDESATWNIMLSRLYDHPVFHVYRDEKAAIVAADAELKRLQEGHCKDCCCARIWAELEGTDGYKDMDIIDHVIRLRRIEDSTRAK